MYEWDNKKNEENLSKHGLNFADVEIVFPNPHLTFEDTRFDYGEPRFITFGLLEGRIIVVAHTPRSKKTRIISMRKANDREKKIYQKRFETTGRNKG